MNRESSQRGVLFDLHGVLVQQKRYTLSKKIKTIHQAWLDRLSVSSFVDTASEIYRKNVIEILTPGIVGLLDYIAQEDIPRAIVTHGGKDEAFRLFAKFNLDRWFLPEHVVYRELTSGSKESSEPYIFAAGILGVAVQNCVMFDDSVFAIDGALKAGIGRIYAVNRPLLMQRHNLIPLISFESLVHGQLFDFLDQHK